MSSHPTIQDKLLAGRLATVVGSDRNTADKFQLHID